MSEGFVANYRRTERLFWAAVKDAVAAEAEACARVAEKFSDEGGYESSTARAIAAAIRARLDGAAPSGENDRTCEVP